MIELITKYMKTSLNMIIHSNTIFTFDSFLVIMLANVAFSKNSTVKNKSILFVILLTSRNKCVE